MIKKLITEYFRLPDRADFELSDARIDKHAALIGRCIAIFGGISEAKGYTPRRFYVKANKLICREYKKQSRLIVRAPGLDILFPADDQQ